MRYGVFHRWILVAFTVLSVGLLGWTAPSGAQILGTTVVIGDTGWLAAGTVDALDSSGDSISTPLLSAEVPDATVIGYLDGIDSNSSLASLTLTVSAGLTVAADSAAAEALVSLTGGPGFATSYISNLSINGVAIPVSGTVNQVVPLPGGQLTINEQQVLLNGTMVVNALHLIVYGAADIVVSSVTAGASGGNAKAVRATTI